MTTAPYVVARTTTDKLEEMLNNVTIDGEVVKQIQYVGGRDWVIIGKIETPERSDQS